MNYQPDVVVADPSGTVIVMVEVRTLSSEGAQTATLYMRNLLAHGVRPGARFVLLVTSEMGYLWTSPDAVAGDMPPDFTFPMQRIIRHYIPLTVQAGPVRELVLESIVVQWLTDLADGVMTDIDGDVQRTLRAAGFLDAVRHGRVQVPSLR